MHNNIPIKLVAYNGPTGELTSVFKSAYVDANGLGMAESHPIQFNVNYGAEANTIFVDAANQGVVNVSVIGNYKLISGWYTISHPSYTFNAGANVIFRSVKITVEQISSSEIRFKIIQVGGDAGSITVSFFVHYEAL